MPSSRLIGVAIFLLGGLALFAVGLFMIGDRRGLFARNFEVLAEFSELAGLENGAAVRVGGMDAGEVVMIHVPARPTAKFRVRARIREDFHGVVRTDSVASIQTEGLVGNKFLQIEGGTDQAPPAPPGSTILSREPFDLEDALRQMGATMTLITETVEMLRGDVQLAIQTMTEVAGEAKGIVADARDDVEAIAASSRRVIDDMEQIVRDVRTGEGTIGKLVTDDALYQRAREIATEAEGVMAKLREAVDEVKLTIAEFRGRSGDATQSTAADLRQTLAHARDAMADLAESAEALKHNFFFRGYFNRRGYFDLDDLDPDGYRAGALEGPHRRALRIWLGADVLFATGPNGRELLTPDGRARIESAMSEFLQYPRSSPIVVEGYAQGATGDLQYVKSHARATLVRSHLLSTFQLDANRVGLMPLGSNAEGSPQGETWDGVAIAIFVPRP